MTHFSIEPDAYLHLARTPITAESPCGTDVRYSPEYEQLEQEVGKSGALHGTGEIDWERVRGGCETLLREQSRDLRVAAWLTWGLYQQHGLTGLTAGLGLLLELCRQSWDGLFPAKPRTRAAAIGWLLPRLEQALQTTNADSALLMRLHDQLTRLDAFLSQQLGELAPVLLPLCRQLETLARRHKPQAVAPAAPAIAPALAPAAEATGSGKPQSDRDAHRLLRGLQEQARTLSDWWLSRKVTDARALRLSRCLLWLPIEALPPADADRVTSLRGLPQERLKHFQALLQQGRHAELLVELETSLARAPFWLDGQHLAWQCLRALGAETAQQALEHELAGLLRRLPGLDTLRFHDGTPFADSATLAWIAGQVLAGTGSEPGAIADDAPWDAGLEQARALLREQDLKAGLQWLINGQQGAQGLRERTWWELAQARLCREAGRPELARALLEALDREAQERDLEAWEPRLALAISRQLHACYEQQGMRERRDELYRRICRLDLQAALN